MKFHSQQIKRKKKEKKIKNKDSLQLNVLAFTNRVTSNAQLPTQNRTNNHSPIHNAKPS